MLKNKFIYDKNSELLNRITLEKIKKRCANHFEQRHDK